MHSMLASLLLLVAGAYALCGNADETLYAVDGAAGRRAPKPSSLYTINIAEETIRLIAEIGEDFEHTVAIASCPVRCRLYALDNGAERDGRLLLLDPITGAIDHPAPFSTGHQIPDMAFGTDLVLYGWKESKNIAPGDELITIDYDTGLTTIIGNPNNIRTADTGIALDHENRIWLKYRHQFNGTHFLAQLNSDGSVVSTVQLSREPDNMLAIDHQGTFWTATRVNGVSTLQTINPITGVVTDAFDVDIEDLAGITFRCNSCGFNSGEEAGIIAGIVVGFILIIACFCCIMAAIGRRRKG